MRILFCTGSPARYMAPPLLGDEQINCGPDWADRAVGGQVLSLATPAGDYDLAAIVAHLPADQQPDAVVCLVDASWRSTPRNLKALRCPKVLLVADTHHLNGPIAGMIRYAQSEPFDRIVLLYDRHHAEFFAAAGLRQLFWFPGLTFPHRDGAVAAARLDSPRHPEIAFVGQTGICHPRRTKMLTHLLAAQLPVATRSVTQRQSLAFYGQSLIGFNASLNGDLNLRTFEVLAGGAMLLTDTLGQGSGLGDLWQNGRELVTYDSAEEMIERARHALAHPAEARRVGDAGAQWFDTNFSDAKRRAAFQAIVVNGTPHPAFPLPAPTVYSTGRLPEATRARLTPGYEYLQELHRNLDRVTVALDESVPEEFVALCATLPRIEVKRGLPAKGTRVDFLAVGRQHFESPQLVAAAHVWPWEAVEADRMTLVRRCTSMGFMVVEGGALIFTRSRGSSHMNSGAVALVRLEQGSYTDALKLAQGELAKNPKSVDALIALCEVAQETSKGELAQSAANQLHAIAPHHPRLRQIMASTPASVKARQPGRLLRMARAYFEQKQWTEVGRLAQEALKLDPKSGEAHFLIGLCVTQDKGPDQALAYLGHATTHAPGQAEYWHELGLVLRKHGRNPDALGALLQATILEADNFIYQLALGEAAFEAGHAVIAAEALAAAVALQPGHAAAGRWLATARARVAQTDLATPRDLLLSHVEVTRLQGTGVLIQRFFPDAANFLTLRSRTLYQGKVDFGGLHFSLDLPGLTEDTRRELVRRLLAPFKVRRILAVPFFASDFEHALAAHEITGAPLCTYVMDDQTLHSRAVPQELAQRLFAASDLRLAISQEMIAEYSAWFRCPFGLLPPIITNRDHETPNAWSPAAGSPRHCAMVGNIWSAQQFEQLRMFVRAAELKVDWFGNANVPWLPQDRTALEADGIFCRGFLPEDQLAERLARYPLVLLPSGTLDGTEDNEWLTRLSLPSRMVFILTKTLTPMLVLGSAKTAAARFVDQFGLGTSSNYDAGEASAKIAEITGADNRTRLLANAHKLAPCFLMPDAGAWIWRSLAAKQAEPTPFTHLYEMASVPAVAAESAVALTAPLTDDPLSFAHKLAAIIPKLSDFAFLDAYLPPDEPRQRPGADVRGAVRFLHEALASFGALPVRILAAERLALLVPDDRPVLVTWAELLEQSGDRAEAAAKARKALSLFYDDVYTQTLFMRCVGDTNFHTDASDRFCPHPFDNFEIYKDGAVFACNCTQVPFPIGNVYQQDANAIWQSPQAQAIRASILDGSFRYCSPMTCYKRFDLPKRSEHPEEFARLQRIGVAGVKKPKELNLSYDLSCNLSCPSCRNGKIMATAEEREKLDHVRDNIVLPLLMEKDAEAVYITGSGDAFGSPHFRGILKQLCDPKFEHVKITLGTNGQLITPRLWEELKPLHARFRDITISIDGATPESYERHRRGSTWDKLQLSMGILSNARRTGAVPRLMVNMVVQQDNFLEMRPLIALCKAWAVDGIRFYRIRQWGNVQPGLFMGSDVANPMHPRHAQLLAELAHPAFADPIVDHYDMYELIERAQAAVREQAVAREKLWQRFQALAEECAAFAASPEASWTPAAALSAQVERLETFCTSFGDTLAQQSATELLAALCGRNQAVECWLAILLTRQKKFTQAAAKARAALELGTDDYVQDLVNTCETNLAGGDPTPRTEPKVAPGIASGKTARQPLPPVSPDAAREQESIKRLAERVRGRTVGFLLHGSSVAGFAGHAAALGAEDVVWVGLNHFTLLEDRCLRPAGKEFSVVFCCADGEVQRRLPVLETFLRRPTAKLLITRPDHFAAHSGVFKAHRDAIALEQLPPLWPYPNSLTIFLRMLVQAGAKRIVLFGCDGYLGDDDASLPTYIGAEEFIREKRPSGVLLDTLLFNAHLPRVLSVWRETLGAAFPEIVNCSPGTMIQAFPTIDYSQAAAALAGKPLVTGRPGAAIDVPVPRPVTPDDPLPDLVACFNAGRRGDLALARAHALKAMRLAPGRMTPFAQRVLQTEPRTIAAAYHFLMLAGATRPGAEQIRAADFAREMRETREAMGEVRASWDTWDQPAELPVAAALP